MALHNISSNPFISPQYPKIRRSTFYYNGIVFDTKELNRMSCTCINQFQRLCHLPSCSSKQDNLILACNFGSRRQIQSLLARSHRFQTGKLKPSRRPSRLTSLIPCQVEKEESKETLSGDSIVLHQETLEQDLQIAIEEEDYELAATIRDRLRVLHEDSKASVLAANARFYNAFKHGDLAAMQTLWTEGDHVCCVHPGVNGISGYDLVMSSWEYVLANYEFPLEIKVKDVIVHVRGDLGFVTCMEFIKTKGSSWGKQSVTNVFEKIDDQWFICIHHASSSSFEK